MPYSHQYCVAILQETSSSADKTEEMVLRPIDTERDCALLRTWFSMDYAVYWSMQDFSEFQIRQFYDSLCASGHASALVGLHHGQPVFLVEFYDPALEEVGEHYEVSSGDWGMHLFIAPATTRIHGFSRRVFALVLRFMFGPLKALRVVVEPDIRNDRVHVLNKDMGFEYLQPAKFRTKTAYLALCTREQFSRAFNQESFS